MRLLLLGAATLALSGCSWLGFGGSNHSNQYNQGQGHYSQAQKSTGCCTKKRLSRWNLEAAVGPEYIVGGTAITGEETNVIDGVVNNGNQSMSDIYDPGFRYELGGSYALSPNRKVTLLGHYAKSDGERVDLGTINGETLSGNLSDYERYGVEAGLRQYIRPRQVPLFRSLRPYVEGRVGVSHIEDINLDNATLGDAAFNGGSAGFYDGGLVPTAAGLVGIEAPIFKRATLGIESGIRYTGNPGSENEDFNSGSSFAGSNNGGSSWTIPVMLRGRYRF